MLLRITTIIMVLALASMACGAQFNLPQAPTAGPTVTDEISVPATDQDAIIMLNFGAGELTLGPGSSELVSGTATYNIPALKPDVNVEDSIVRIKQGDMNNPGILPTELKNIWDLKLGSSPIDLQIEAGAYKARYELGGLALTKLSVQDGASDVSLKFSEPNMDTMTLMRYETGASNVNIEGIGNASPALFIFKCGAGNYNLDFSGQLQQDMDVQVEAGLGNLTLVIPEGIPARVIITKGLSNVIANGWEQSGDIYTQDGSGPTITINADIGVGNLTLSH